MAVEFSDYFWGEDHNGWNVLYQNMKQGHNASKELAEFFKERWVIDETYSKALAKLANKANNNNERGSLTPIFGLLKTSLEMMASVHLHMMNKIQEHVKEMVKYNDELHKKQKAVKDEESQTEEVVKLIQNTSTLAQKAKDLYNQRCQDLEKAKRDGASPKDVEKAEAKLKKAHDDYKNLVDKYNTIRDDFEKKLTQSCKRFQKVEETHLAKVLHFGQSYINVLIADHKAIGQINSELSHKYSQMTVDHLLDKFALTKHTGLEKPVIMVFEDTGSLGSAVSGQQSPEPADHSKSSEDAPTQEKTGVLAGGSMVEGGSPLGNKGVPSSLSGVAKLSSKKDPKSNRSLSSLFSLKRGGGASPKSDIAGTDEKAHSEQKTKDGRRTTSLLNLFVPSASMSGMNETREWSAPPFVKCSSVDDSTVERRNGENPVVEEGTWPGGTSLPTSPKVTSAPSSPSGEQSLGRSLFRSSKLAQPGSGPMLSFGFLRSRRDKKKEKNRKKKKDTDSPKDDKSDNENSEEMKTTDLLSIDSSNREEFDGAESSNIGHDGSRDDFERSQDDDAITDGWQEPRVDKDGYMIRPDFDKSINDNSFDSSSDSDSDVGLKKIHVEIKPIANGTNPSSASVDELRATIENMSFLPLGVNTSNTLNRKKKALVRFHTLDKTRRTSNDHQAPIRRSNSTTQPMSSSSSDLLGLNFNVGNSQDEAVPTSTASNVPKKTLTNSVARQSPKVLTPPPRADRYAELSEILGETSSIDSNSTPSLPPKSSASRGSTPTPGIALPRPPSRKILENVGPRASPAGLSRAESTSSLEFRTSGAIPGISRGPSPLTLGMADTIPLAVAFQEHCHAYFKGTVGSRVQMKVTGEMMVSFPAGIVGVLANNPSPAQLSFKVLNFGSMESPLPNKQLIQLDESQSTDSIGVYNFNMESLAGLLRKQAEQNPSASFFNVDIIKYQVAYSNPAKSAPLQLVSYWRCEDSHTDLRVDYKYNSSAMSPPSPLLNVTVSVPVDGVVKNMQSKPHGQWLKEQQKAQWKITELCDSDSGTSKGSLRGKFEVAAGPSTPTTVSAQFICEGTTLSGLDFGLVQSGYRLSLVKKRFVSGKYICDADAVLRLRYGAMPS